VISQRVVIDSEGSLDRRIVGKVFRSSLNKLFLAISLVLADWAGIAELAHHAFEAIGGSAN
jgi:hypothetical protein